MEITEVKVRLAEASAERLRAFCTITLDHEFVVRDIKIIEGSNGLFVAMPSRKVTEHCPKCHGKNHLRAKYCNDCGTALPGQRTPNLSEAGSKLHVDVAHPINSECRSRFQKTILAALDAELQQTGRNDHATPTSNHASPATDDESSDQKDSTQRRSFGEGIV